MKFTSSVVLAALFATTSSIKINLHLVQGPNEIFGTQGGPIPEKIEVPAVMPEIPKEAPKPKLTEEEIAAIQQKKKADQDARNEQMKIERIAKES